MHEIDNFDLFETNLQDAFREFDSESKEIQEFYELFRSFIENGEIPKNQDRFVTKTVPFALSVLQKISPVDIEERVFAINNLLEIYSLLTEALSNDIFVFGQLIVTIFNERAPIFKTIGINSSKTSQFLVSLVANYIKSKGFCSLVERINNSEKPATVDHFSSFLIIVEKSQKFLERSDLGQLVDDTFESLIKFYKSLDSAALRSIDNEKLLVVVVDGIYVSSLSSHSDQIIVSTMDFSIMLLRCDFLDKQLIGIRGFTEGAEKLSKSNPDLFIEYAKKSNFLDILAETNFHESVLERSFGAIKLFIMKHLVGLDFLNKMWIKSKKTHTVQKKAIYNVIIHCILYMNLNNNTDGSPQYYDFLQSISNEPISLDSIDFMRMIAINFSTNIMKISNMGAKYLLTYMRNPPPEYAQNLFLAIKDITKYAVPSALLIYLLTETSDIFKSTVNMHLIQLLEAIIDSNVLSYDVELIDTIITQQNNEDYKGLKKELLHLLLLFLEKSQKKLTCAQVTALFKNEDDLIYDFFTQLFEMCSMTVLLYPAAFNFITEKLDGFDYENKTTVSFARFACEYEVLVGKQNHQIIETNINSSPTKKLPKWTPTALDAKFKYTLKILNLSNNDDAANVIMEFIEGFVLQGRTKFSNESFKFILKVLNETLFQGSDKAKIRCIKILLFLVPKFEQDIDIEDFGLRKHAPDNKDKITITIENLSIPLEIQVNPSISVDALRAKIAVRCSIPKNCILLYYGENQLSRIFSLMQYGITKDTSLNVHLLDQKTKQYTNIHLPSYILYSCGFVDLFFSFLDSDCIELVENSYALLKNLQTSQIALNIAKSDNIIDTIISSKNWQRQSYILVACYETILDSFNENEEEEEEEEEYYDEEEQRREVKKKNKETPLVFNKDKELLEVFIQGKIDIKAGVQCLKLLSYFKPPEIERYIQQFYETTLKIFEEKETNPIDCRSAFLLMTEIAPKKLTNVMFCERSILAESIMSFDFTRFIMLSEIISKLPFKKPIWTFLSKYIDLMQEHDDVSCAFMVCLSQSLSKECDISSVLEKLLTFLPTAKHNLFKGICTFFSSLIEIFPNALPAKDIGQILATRLVHESEIKVQKDITKILTFLIQQEQQKNKPKKKQKKTEEIPPQEPQTENQETVFNIISNILMKTIEEPIDEFQYIPTQKLHAVTSMRGLKNLGATCYMNSVLQQFYSNKDFRLHLLGLREDKDWIKDLQRIFAYMQLSNKPSQSTMALCKSLKVNPIEQQDAVEFLQRILDELPKVCSESYTGRIVNTIEGIHEEFKVFNTETFFTMTLDVKGFSCFEESFESFLQEENFVGDNQYLAESLGKKIDAKRSTRIDECPTNLIIQLKRFEYDLDTYQRYKVDDRFEFPFDFDIAPYTSHPDNHINYKLTGIVIHDGLADVGHYYSIIKIEDKWFMFNDKQVSEFPEEYIENEAFGRIIYEDDEYENTMFSPSAYILFYTKAENEDIHAYSKDIEASKSVICPELLNEIENNNKVFMKLESIFTEQFGNFIVENFSTNKELFVTYFINVFMHSTLHLLSNPITLKMTKILPELVSYLFDPEKQSPEHDQLVRLLLVRSDPFCQNSLSQLLEMSIKIMDEEQCHILFEHLYISYYHIPKIEYHTTVLQSYTHIMHMISKKVKADNKMIREILTLIERCCAEAETTFQNISELLQIICENCDVVDHQSLQILHSFALTILMNPLNCTHLLAVYIKAEQCGLCSKDHMISMLIQEADPNMIKSLFISCITLMIPASEVMSIFIGNNVDRTLLARAITIIPARNIVVSNATTLIFPFLTSSDVKIRQIMEQYIGIIIPTKSMPKKAESILSDEEDPVFNRRQQYHNLRNIYCGQYGYDDSSDDSMSSVDDSDDEAINLDINLELLSSLLVSYAKKINIQKIYTIKNSSLTAFARTIQRLAKHVPSVDLCKVALRLLFAVSEYDTECDANKLELSRAAALFDIETIRESLEEDADSVLELLFPISFDDYEFGCQLFASSLRIIESLCDNDDTCGVLMMVPEFINSIYEFVKLSSSDECEEFITFVSQNQRAQPLYDKIEENKESGFTSKQNLLKIVSSSSVAAPPHVISEAILGGLKELVDMLQEKLNEQSICTLCDMVTKVSSNNTETISPEIISVVINSLIPIPQGKQESIIPHVIAMILPLTTEETKAHINRLFTIIQQKYLTVPILALFLPFLDVKNTTTAITHGATDMHFPPVTGINLFLEEVLASCKRHQSDFDSIRSYVITLIKVIGSNKCDENILDQLKSICSIE